MCEVVLVLHGQVLISVGVLWWLAEASPVSTGSVPAGFKMVLQLLLAKAEPITDGASVSEII